jgi:hypothetical protein
MKILINAREKDFNEKHIGYDEVVKLAFPDTDLSKYLMTVTYVRKAPFHMRYAAILAPNDQKIEVSEGMRFNATMTWNG